jgi:hypothetical protein
VVIRRRRRKRIFCELLKAEREERREREINIEAAVVVVVDVVQRASRVSDVAGEQE